MYVYIYIFNIVIKMYIYIYIHNYIHNYTYIHIDIYIYTPQKTDIAPENGSSQKDISSSKESIFRGELLVSGRANSTWPDGSWVRLLLRFFFDSNYLDLK